MALSCLEMYNQNAEKKGVGAPPISPRISFSNDFLESSSQTHSQAHPKSQTRASSAYRDAPVSSDFEFSVGSNSMMSADELFFKGRLIPLKEHKATTTLKDELQIQESDDDFSLRPPKNPTRWKGFLALKKSHHVSKKPDEDAQCSNNPQDSIK